MTKRQKRLLYLCAFLLLIFISSAFWWFFRPSKDFIVAVTENSPPFTYMEEGNLTGFDIDLISEIGKSLHKKVKFKIVQRAELIGIVKARKATLAISGIPLSIAKSSDLEYFKYKPLLPLQRYCFVNLKDPQNTDKIPSNRSIRIGAESNSEAFSCIQRLSLSSIIGENSDLKIFEMDSFEDLLIGLEEKNLDYIFMNERSFHLLNKMNNNTLNCIKILNENSLHSIDSCISMYYAIIYRNNKISKEVSNSLEKIKKSEIYDNLRNKWLTF